MTVFLKDGSKHIYDEVFEPSFDYDGEPFVSFKLKDGTNVCLRGLGSIVFSEQSEGKTE